MRYLLTSMFITLIALGFASVPRIGVANSFQHNADRVCNAYGQMWARNAIILKLVYLIYIQTGQGHYSQAYS